MTNATKRLDGLSVLAPEYPALLCDVWGVIHNGRGAHVPALKALSCFRAAGGTVLLITNSPRPSVAIARELAGFGIGEIHYDAMVSSGDVIRDLIIQHSGRPL
ncbi:MAG TPA: TIGR01459 family HAD-type hydrolase, partial [Devosiaceae bacterium]|nr:TIGR01459 family HAD-type hydrolase [Devosiaceae bacterium]